MEKGLGTGSLMAGEARSSPIRVLALMEAVTVGGPSKNLIQIGKRGAAAIPEGWGVQLGIVTFQRGLAREPSAFVQAAAGAGLSVHVLQERRRFDWGPARQLSQIVEQWRPDIIQSHNIKSHLLVRLLGLHRRFPWVVFQHGYTHTDWKDRVYNQVDRWTLPAADRVVAVCGAFAQRLERRGIEARRIRVQHNSVQPFQAPPEEETHHLRGEYGLTGLVTMLAVGRLSLEKGHADLLKSLAGLPATGLPAWKLLLVGDGPERGRLEELRERLGLKDRVIFAGHQSEVRRFYAAADMLVLPSHTEGSPNVVLEAMAAAVPVVACAVGGVPEILRDGETGLLAPAGDTGTLTRQIQQLLGDEALRRRLAAAARQDVEQYSPERQYRTLVDTYRDLLTESGRRGN